MESFEYYGLFLTEGSKTKLKQWLWINDYDFNNDLIKGVLPKNWYLDHCTVLHVPQSNYIKEAILEDRIGERHLLTINGIGVSDKAMAFRIDRGLLHVPCSNNIPHITICTFNGGKPVDSNNITEWENIRPIIVEAKLERR